MSSWRRCGIHCHRPRVSILSLGLRAGAIVVVSIPLVLAIVFAAMYALGIDLQRISLGALIIALGLLVDDAMITIESMVFRLERGDDKPQAAIFAYASTALPRLTGTLVTIAAFVPIGLARMTRRVHVLAVRGGCAGPAGVLAGVRHLRTGRRRFAAAPAEGGAWRDTERADAPVQTLPVGGHASKMGHYSGHGCPLRGCALGTRFVPEQFFPSSDRPELLVDLSLQDNASVLATRDDVAAEFDKMLAADRDIERFSTYVGQGAIRFYLPIDVALPNDASPSRSW